MAVYHVRPRDDGDWEVKKRGASRASFVGSEAAAKSKVDTYVEEGDTKVLHNADGSVFKREKVTGARKQRRSSTMQSVRRSMGDSPFDR